MSHWHSRYGYSHEAKVPMLNAVSGNSEPSLLPPVELSVKNSNLQKGSAASLMVAATGVVFGDIGTSPLYALQQCFSSTNGIPFSSDAMFGVLSMVLWAFIIVVSLKYVVFVMRADNNGEGGILGCHYYASDFSAICCCWPGGIVIGIRAIRYPYFFDYFILPFSASEKRH